MADDRAVLDPAQELVALRKLVDDLKTTVMTRTLRRPTGTIEATLLTAQPGGGLFLNGQTVSRATYPALWQWANDNLLVGGGPSANAFGIGDGSTTFSLPDFRGRVVRGVAASGEGILQNVGADTTTSVAAHTHSISTDGSHFSHPTFVVSINNGTGGVTNNILGGEQAQGSHNHGGTGSTGSASVDIRQASVSVNWLIYT